MSAYANCQFNRCQLKKILHGASIKHQRKYPALPGWWLESKVTCQVWSKYGLVAMELYSLVAMGQVRLLGVKVIDT